MSLATLVGHATDKTRFQTIQDYISFCKEYLQFIKTGLQARIVSQNENHYQFYQYQDDGHYNITRPINTSLMYETSSFDAASIEFLQTLEQLKDRQSPDARLRQVVICTIYTIQQSIGATLDALPSGRSNQARKVNGDLFERLIRLIISALNIDCVAGTYYCDIRPNMVTDSLLSQHIQTIDHFFYDDLWNLLSRHGQSLEEVEVEEGENEDSEG